MQPMTTTVAVLSVAIIARDEERHIGACLESIVALVNKEHDERSGNDERADIADDIDIVVILDDRTRDQTEHICQSYGARVFVEPWRGYAAQRNRALDVCRGEWVLFVDGDERLTPELRRELRQLCHHGIVQLPPTWSPPGAERDWEGESGNAIPIHPPTTRAREGPVAGYSIPRHNIFFGRVVRGGGWYPDYQLRLLRRTLARYDEQHQVHEYPHLKGQATRLRGHLLHINIEQVGEFWHKQARYALAEARTLAQQGQQVRWRNFVGGPVREFWRRYGQLGGWRDGWLGLFLCGSLAWFELVKFACLYLLRGKRCPW